MCVMVLFGERDQVVGGIGQRLGGLLQLLQRLAGLAL